MKDFERRYLADVIEMRGLPGDGAVLIGHGAVFNEVTTIAGAFREVVMPGAFKKTIKEADVRALFNHDPSMVLGRNRAGTLRLTEDERGLAYEIDLPDTQTARDLYTSIARGDVSQSSFSFSPVGETRKWWEYPKDDEEEKLPLRRLKELRLMDVSPVTFPQYEGTDVDLSRALRSLAMDLSRPLADVMADVRAGHLIDETTEEPEHEPREHSESTQPPAWKVRARRELQLIR
jgi:HK97 family phage prohead protease